MNPVWKAVMNILIIDDREYDALELHTKLSSIIPSASITWSCSSDQALEKIRSSETSPFDAVFIDQYMPGRLGTEVVPRIKEALNRKTTPVVMLTSDGSDKTRARALVSDCDGFLTKPVDPNRLLAFVKGARCQWELSDLPTNLELYWKIRDGQQHDDDALAVT